MLPTRVNYNCNPSDRNHLPQRKAENYWKLCLPPGQSNQSRKKNAGPFYLYFKRKQQVDG